ncbi:MAG: hypothetical protein M3Q84_02840, partial [Actinomycetota bacterium]|nr:hypothetical protein [Actinomycetota bacterium]
MSGFPARQPRARDVFVPGRARHGEGPHGGTAADHRTGRASADNAAAGTLVTAAARPRGDGR